MIGFKSKNLSKKNQIMLLLLIAFNIKLLRPLQALGHIACRMLKDSFSELSQR